MQTTTINPSDAPVTVEEVLTFCKIDDSEKETVETILIPGVLDLIEFEAKRPLVRRQYVEHFERFPDDGRKYLSRGPISELTSIEQQIENDEGVKEWIVQDLTDFDTYLTTLTPWISKACGTCQAVCSCCPEPYRVTYTAGPEKCEIPDRSKPIILSLICSMNANRLAASEANLKETPIFKRLIRSLKRPTI